MSIAPLIAITLGDPAGVGPEVVAKALTRGAAGPAARVVVVGSARVLDRAFDLIGSPLRAIVVEEPQASAPTDRVAVLDDGRLGLEQLPYGRLSENAGAAAVAWATRAAQMAIAGEVAGIATAPLNKEAAHLAGHDEVGHQEIYQALTNAPDVVTMLMTQGLRVVHLTTHRSLRLACDAVTRDNVLGKLRLTHDFFASHGFPAPRIAVAALNPHGGEHGLIGMEELDEILPAVEEARELGIDVTGPVPADSVFNQAISGRYDAVLAMYHDQGHIAIKVQGWEASTTMNLGLPFLRTSVDHGTAFDIAGQGIADATGMVEAISLAAHVATTGKLPGA